MAVLHHHKWVAQPAATLPPLQITTASLPGASNGTAYSTTLAATGGQSPYTWSLLSAVPNSGSWLSCSSAGVLTGTPGTIETEVVLAQVQDSQGTKSSRFLSITVTGVALSITTSSPLPAATAGSAYSFTMGATGGVPPYTWSITADTPNTGGWLSISSGGVLSGTPGTAETESVTIKVQDSSAANTSGVFSLTVNASGGTIYFQENYTGVPTGNVSLTSAWTSKGYVSFENNGIPANLQVLTRAGMPAGLLSSPNFPAGKTTCCLFDLSASEINARITWAGLGNTTTRTLWISYWEYRDNTNLGGEKWVRVGSYQGGTLGGNRLQDIIYGLGVADGVTLFANGSSPTGMHDFGDHAYGKILGSFPPGLHHFEVGIHLSDGLLANGSAELWMDGVQIANATGLQYWNDATAALIGLQLFDTGGWSSTGGGTQPGFAYPIIKYYCAFRIASSRQGVWAMPAV